MDSTDKRQEAKLDKIAEDVCEIKIILGKQHVSLDDHIRRTELLENDVAPLKEHLIFVKSAVKIGGAVASIITLVGVIVGILEYFKH
jgi:hypothetical protein